MSLQISLQTEKIEGVNQIRERLGNSGSVRQSVTPILQQAARVGVQSARIYAPKGRSANLVNAIDDKSVSFQVRGDAITARFGVNPVPTAVRGSRLYPLYVHEGTGVYGRLKRMITPKRASHMVFPGKTGIVVTVAVRGQRPQPYMRHGFEDASQYIEQHLDDMVRRMLDE